MPPLLLSSEQRFTCAQCGRCCHRTTVPVTVEEAKALRRAGAAQWFDEGGAGDLSRRSAAGVELVRGHRISRAALARLRTFLALLLDRPPSGDARGLPDLRSNLRRIAALLEDWSRPQVLRLEPEALVEYLELTGNYALSA